MGKLPLFFIRDIIALSILNIFLQLSANNGVLSFFEKAQIRAIPFFIPPAKPKNKEFSVEYHLKGKKRSDIYLTRQHDGYNSEPFDILRMNFIFRELQRISFACKNNEVVVVHFTDECTIGDWVALLNLAIEARLKRYTFWNDAFYFFGNEADKLELPSVSAKPNF